MSTLEEKIAVMQAFGEGKEIEVRSLWEKQSCWGYVVSPCWDWASSEYRVKPRKPREIWVNEYPEGLGDLASETKEEADRHTLSGRIRCVKFIEVIEE